MSILEKNFQLAEEARDYAVKIISLGASNKPCLKDASGNEKKHMGLNAFEAVQLNRVTKDVATSMILGSLGLFSETLNLYKNESTTASIIGVQTTCLMTQLFRAGNCQEQASLAYKFLSDKGVYPLEICNIKDGDHVFVIIGRNQNSNIKDPSTWGENAVICDPWSQNHYANNYKKWLKQMNRPSELIKNLAVIHSRQPSQLGYFTSSIIESASFFLLRGCLKTFSANGSLNISGKSLFVISIGLTSMLRTIKKYNQKEQECDTELNQSQNTLPIM